MQQSISKATAVPPVDVEALRHARNCVVDQNDTNPHRLDSRALEALDRAIDEAEALEAAQAITAH